jgi:hypothetical protein
MYDVPARSIATLIGDGTLDPELAAELWLLIGARVPIIVATQAAGSGTSTLLTALLDFLPPTTRVVELAGETETFDWLPQASELGWPGKPPIARTAEPVRPDTTVLLATELSGGLPSHTWGEVARIAVRAASIGYGLAATIHADSLEDVFGALQVPPTALTEDECSHLGIVLILRRLADGRRRVTAAHYVRPIARDVHGHTQRLGPAVLATWDPQTDQFEHFGWGVIPELAARVGLHAGDFEIERERRETLLGELVTTGVHDSQRVRDAIRTYRPAEAFDAPQSGT